ncbi:MAG: GumC family protein [Devosia nanyangense]|uniref:GumC family protein n=1 Tax=Devosia nanyangense TaxID=1228055 RepID=A0A933L4C8_9HYPH|nr:GumC family protein [Devosia nanyangense]
MTVESTPAEDLRMDAGALMGALWARAIRIVVVTALLVVATFALLLFVPKQYESVASLLVEDRTSSFTQTATTQTPTTNSGITIDALMSSQVELVKSRDTLLAVVDTLNLRSVAEFNGAAANPLTMILTLVGRKPEPKSIDETVLQNLNERLTVIRERDSAVLSVYARSADPQLAAKIANAIAAEHVRRRATQLVTDTAEATAWLQQQIDTLRVKVQEADTMVANYKSDNSIFAGTNGTTLPDQQISDIGKQITDAQQLKNAAEQHADLIRKLIASGQSVDGVEDVRNSAVIQSLMNSRATLQSTLAEKLATLLPAHPTIVALNAQIAQINTQIRSEAKRIADGLDAQVTIEDGVIQSLNDDLARARLAASTQTKDSVTLDSLTREAKAQRDLLDGYLLKYRDASGRTDTGSVLPDVRVITQAAPSVVPASPKTALILGAVGVVALVLQVGTVLFGELMSGRAVYDRTLHEAVEPEFESVGEDGEDIAAEAEAAEDDVDLADMPEPAYEAAAVASPVVAPPRAEPVAAPEPRHRAVADGQLALSNLSADIALGRVRVVLLAAVSEARDAAIVADRLVSDALHKGLSICRVDAGSGRPSTALGITDLCGEQASFGDVVHKVREGLAEVPWGHLTTLDRRSMRPVTLLEALGDIYEVVIVSTGRVGLNSSLPVFAGVRGRLVMVRQNATPAVLVDAVTADAAALGFEVAPSVLVPERQSEVA